MEIKYDDMSLKDQLEYWLWRVSDGYEPTKADLYTLLKRALDTKEWLDSVGATTISESAGNHSSRSTFVNLAPQLENHVKDVEQLMALLALFHEARERTYRLSFAKRGESGIWMNLARKYDRLDGLVERVLADGVEGDTLIDTLIDTAVYALKWVAVIKRIRPDDLDKWVRSVYARDTGVDPDEASKAFLDWDEACVEDAIKTADYFQRQDYLDTLAEEQADYDAWSREQQEAEDGTQ